MLFCTVLFIHFPFLAFFKVFHFSSLSFVLLIIPLVLFGADNFVWFLTSLSSLHKQPIDMHKSKRLWCCCCASGRIKARVWTEHAGVVPGQTLYLKMDIDNQSGRRLQSVTVKLIQFVRYIGRRRDWLSTSTQHRETSNILLEKTLDKTQVEDWSNIGIKIPPVVPSDLPYCNIIHVHYQVLVSARFDHNS